MGLKPIEALVSFFRRESMIYFICGHRGSGKTYLAKQISSATGISMFDTGPVIREEYKSQNKGESFSQWLEENTKKEGKDFTNSLICKHISYNNSNDLIIIGNRSILGINYIVDFLNNPDYRIVYIDGDYDLFRKNFNQRENLSYDMPKFMKIINLELEMGMDDVKAFILDNPDKSYYFYKEKNDNAIFDSLINLITNNNHKEFIKVKKKELNKNENIIGN